MQSLRTRRPSQARPKGQKPPGRNVPARDNLARKSTRVDDKIKKRMSMRYADISSPTGGDIPAVPTIPLALRPGGVQGQGISMTLTEEPKEDPREAELRLLDQDDFDPDACEFVGCLRQDVGFIRKTGDRFEVEDGELDGGGAALSPIVTASV